METLDTQLTVALYALAAITIELAIIGIEITH